MAADEGWNTDAWAAPEILDTLSGEYRVDTHHRAKLGKGRFGIVYRGFKDGKFAVKCIEKNHAFEIEEVRHSANQLKNLSHENLVKIFDVKGEQDMIWIIMEYCDKRDLETHMKTNQLNLGERLDILLKISMGLDYLHHKEVIHREVKPANILLHGQIAKLGDFDTSKHVDPASSFSVTSSWRGTIDYYSPELFQREEGLATYDKQSDIFSLALTFLAILQHSPGKPMQPKLETLESPVEKAIGQIVAEKVNAIAVKTGWKNIAIAAVSGVAVTAVTGGHSLWAGVAYKVASVVALAFGSGGVYFVNGSYQSYADKPFEPSDDDSSKDTRKKREQLRELIQSMVAVRPKQRPNALGVRMKLLQITGPVRQNTAQ